MFVLGMWIAYEYLIDFVARMPRLFVIGSVAYFVFKMMGAPI